MALLYETSILGISIEVYSDRVDYKAGFLSPLESIPISQISSIRSSSLLNRLVIVTTGGREYAITTGKKQEVTDAIYRAQAALRSMPMAFPIPHLPFIPPPAPMSHGAPQRGRTTQVGVLVLVGLVVVLVIAGVAAVSGDRKDSTKSEAPAVSATVSETTGNVANDMLLARTPAEQASFLARVVDGCTATRAFYMGISAQDQTASWSVACRNGLAYSVAIDADEQGSTSVLDCRALKAIADIDCFVSFESQVKRPPRTKKQILADINRLPPTLRKQVMAQFKQNLKDYVSE